VPDGRIESLFSLPLEEFTTARNALAGELRKSGDREASDEVKSLRKPTVSAWAANQLARREKERVRALLSAGGRLRKAQTGLLKGGDAQELRDALAAEGKAVDELVEAAAAMLAETGHGSTHATLRRLATTLQAAAVDEEAGAALSAGVLTADLEPRGLETLMQGFTPGKTGRAAPRQRGQERERERERERELRQELDTRKRELRAAEEAAAASRREASAREKAVEKARVALERASERLDAARSRTAPG
jgi:uncharacterized protein YaaQ